MSYAVYILCALTSLACAILLGRAYWTTRSPLLFWSVACFGALTLTNILLFIDLAVVEQVDLRTLRSGVTLAGLMALLYGLTFGEK